MFSSVSAPAGRYGGKAGRLQELQAAGFHVPPFVVSPSDVAAAVRRLGEPLVVRSSAAMEDGEDVSMAGQLRSFLNLRGPEEVERAIRDCRASAGSEAVRRYCRNLGIDPDRLRMDVIVQRMVQPELAGVVFTVNPATGAEEIVIEACEGMGEELLSGRRSPLPPDAPLLRKHAPLIAQTARRIQRRLGAPQDFEFAIENGTLYVLQSRPITRIGFAPDLGEWTNADFRDGGVSSTVCSPLMWSLYEFVWDRTLKQCLRQLGLWIEDFQAGRMFFGRPYWNLGAVKTCLAKLPGFVERAFDEDLNVEIRYEGDGRSTAITLAGVILALPNLLAIRAFLRGQQRFDERFLAGGFDAMAAGWESAGGDVESSFRRLIKGDYFLTESNYFRTIFAASLAKMDFSSSFPDADYGALAAGLPPLRYLAPVRLVRNRTGWSNAELRSLILRFRHHYRQGLDILRPRWDEDVEFVTEILRSLPPSAPADPRAAFEAARSKTAAQIPRRKRRTFARKLETLRRLVWLREEMRDLSNRMYHLIRRQVLEIARRRKLGDDIFFMTFRQIFDDDRSQVDRQRETYEGYRHFQAPNEIGHRFPYEPRSVSGDLLGIGASPGTARGRAHLARNVEQALRIEPDQILVCPFTDPGWTPVLDRAAGVVTEAGGLLSHAAVICREFGVPAVLGVPGATKRIRPGAAITVRGSEGRVEIPASDDVRGL